MRICGFFFCDSDSFYRAGNGGGGGLGFRFRIFRFRA